MPTNDEIRRAGYALTTPCKHCPFRTDMHVFLTHDRAKGIAEVLRDSGSFHCHKTVTHDEEGGVEHSGQEQQCAGALILMENDGTPGQVVRVAERLGLYSTSRMDLDAPVYASISEWVRAHAPAPETAVVGGEELEYEHCGVVGPECVDPAGYQVGSGVAENDDPPTCHPDQSCQYCGNVFCSGCRGGDNTCVYCAEEEDLEEE